MLIHRTIPVLVAGFMVALAACGDPVEPAEQNLFETGGEALSAHDAQACHAVQGRLEAAGFQAVLSGDLVGTAVAVPASTRTAGNTVHVTGVRRWDITGGSVPALVGSSFQTDYASTLTGEPPILRADERNTAREGVAVANLTLHGTVDVSGFPTIVTSLAYRGMICP